MSESDRSGRDAAIGESAVKRSLAEAGIAVPAGTTLLPLPPPGAAGSENARSALLESVERARVPEPFVVKLTGPGLVHKTELGAVRVGVPLRRLHDTVVELSALARTVGMDGTGRILVEEFVGGGVELLAGMTVDSSFGRVGVVGLGGVAADVQSGTRCAALPLLSRAAVDRFVEPVLAPLRRMGAVETFADLVTSLMGEAGVMLRPEILEMDLNPIVVTRDRIVVVDAWARVESVEAPAADRRVNAVVADV